MSQVIFIGYMGCGKSVIAKMLAYEYGYDYVDLDKLIEKRQGMSVRQIFVTKGEEYFRQVEREELLKILGADKTIVAAGGGTPCFFDNMQRMNQSAVTVYLKVDPDQLFRRLRKVKHARPLIAHLDDHQLKEYIIHSLRERESYYMQASIIITDIREQKTLIASFLE